MKGNQGEQGSGQPVRREVDVDRSHCCVKWWSTEGGRELVLFGAETAPDESDESGP
jgi:hypothetical protein